MAYAISRRHPYLGRHPARRKGGGANMTDFSFCSATIRHDPAMKLCLGFSTPAPAPVRNGPALLALAGKPMNTD